MQDSSGIFWDNDGLASLLASELKADLLVLLSDVEGLYSCPPSDPKSKLIHTYVKKKHHGEITFGDKSRLGRGGMTAKVEAAICAADAGIPVIITRYHFIISQMKVPAIKTVWIISCDHVVMDYYFFLFTFFALFPKYCTGLGKLNDRSRKTIS